MNSGQPKNRTCALCATALLALVLFAATALSAADWRAKRAPLEETITGISFPSPMVGFFVTSGGKFGMTSDGGEAWTVFSLSDKAIFEDVFFKNNDTGLAVGRFGRIYRTIDGGKQWEDRHLKTDSTSWLTSVVFLKDSVALATGLVPGAAKDGILYRSTDYGMNWTKVDISGIGFGELFYAKGSPVCFQSFGKLHYSTDQGATWQTLSTVSGKPGRSTAFYNNTGVLCGNDAMCAFSHDRGKTWTTVPMEGGAALTSAILVNDSLGYISGTGGFILKTTDGGKTWKKEENIPITVDLADITTNGRKVFAVGQNGFILIKDLDK